MFEDFSFACASRQLAVCRPYQMHHTVSPTSSRESTPGYDAGYDHASSSERGYPIATSIAELSQYFDQHTLAPRRPSICLEASIPRARELNPPHHSATSFSNRVCRRRQSLNRLQCSSDHHLSRISALVEEMVQAGQPLYDPTHPATLLEDDSLSPSLSADEIPPMPSPMASYFNSPSSSSSSSSSRPSSSFRPSSSLSFSSNCDPRLAQHSLRHAHSYKIDKDVRHRASREGIGKPMVSKKIRMRKSLKKLEGGAKGRER